MENCRITIMPAGWQLSGGNAASVLTAAEAAGVVLPSACRNGTCRTSMCKMERGAVRYLIAWPGLSIEEKREGWILPCVALPETDLVLTVAAARRLA